MYNFNVSDIQHFSTGDGPGIRTTLFLKGCNLHCPWCHNPETLSGESVTIRFPRTGTSKTYGTIRSMEEVLAALMQDAEFYEESGGGVTVGGGEPMLQYLAVAELFRELHEYGIHTLIDTAGSVPWAYFETVLPYTDCFFFDWKGATDQFYREVTGGDFRLVKENLSRLIEAGKDVHVRIPVIPGCNDGIEDRGESIRQLRELGVQNVDLLPFHRLGSSKYEAMGMRWAFSEVKPPKPAEMEAIAKEFACYFRVGRP